MTSIWTTRDSIQSVVEKVLASDDTYGVLSSIDKSALIETVNILCKEGYRPLGGVAVLYDPRLPAIHYYQAIVKPPAKEKAKGARR
jgi:hypothetical protein